MGKAERRQSYPWPSCTPLPGTTLLPCSLSALVSGLHTMAHLSKLRRLRRGFGTCPRLQGPGLLVSLASSLSLPTVCLLCPLPQGQRPRPIRPWDPSTCVAWATVGSTEPSASCAACEACRGPSVELVPTAVTEPACGQQVSECRPEPSDSTFGAPSFLKIMLVCSPLVINLVRVQ